MISSRHFEDGPLDPNKTGHQVEIGTTQPNQLPHSQGPGHPQEHKGPIATVDGGREQLHLTERQDLTLFRPLNRGTLDAKSIAPDHLF
jgi:hypothetical protein